MQETNTIKHNVTADQSALLRCLLYFAVFDYPLTERELYENSTVSCSRNEIPGLLRELCVRGLLQQQGEYYLAAGATDSAIVKRLKGNTGATHIMGTALKYSRRISRFPFVRGVCLSGALSKNYYDEKGDIDYFIIAKPGRLWICRTLLILYYKFLPEKKKKFWCVNYFVSSDDLVIPDQNVFTATELAHLVPVYNYPLYRNLLQANEWYQASFPNKEPLSDKFCSAPGPEIIKKFAEAFFTGWGNKLDDWLLRATLRRWRIKYPDLPMDDFELQFRSRKNVCKRHSIGFQNKVLGWWKDKQVSLEKSHNIELV